MRPKHIHFEVETKFDAEAEEDFESCDLRFYSVEKVKPEVNKDGEEQESERRRLEDEEDDKKKQQEEVKGAPKGPSKEYESIEFSDVAFFRLGYFGY